HVGHLVETLQSLHHHLADGGRWDLRFAETLKTALDAVDDALDALLVDRPLAASREDRAGNFIAVEGNALAILLHNHQFAKLDTLKGREPRATGRAEPSASNGGVVLRRP